MLHKYSHSYLAAFSLVGFVILCAYFGPELGLDVGMSPEFLSALGMTFLDTNIMPQAKETGFDSMLKIHRRIVEELAFVDASTHKKPAADQLPWYLGGNIRPDPENPPARLWPDANTADRIVSQLMFAPKAMEPKTIYLDPSVPSWHNPNENLLECPVSTCTVTRDEVSAQKADLVIAYNKLKQIQTNSQS